MSKARQTVETLRTVLVAGDVTNANFTGADLDIAKGGTGASSAGAARTALGLVVGTDVLAPDGNGSSLTGVDSLPSQTSQSGKFLTTNGSAASWGEAGGAWDLLETITASSSSTVDFTTFSSNYDQFNVQFLGVVPASNNVRLWLRTSINGGTSYDTGSTDYSYAVASVDTDNNSVLKLSGPDEARNYIDLLGYQATKYTASWGGINGELRLYAPAAAHNTMMTCDLAVVTGDGRVMRTFSGGMRNTASAVNGLRFYMQSGAIASGIFRLYGLKKS